MQLLASLHVVFTCSFVFLLAYLLSRILTYLAHSVIHGSPSSRARRAEGSSRGRRSELSKAQQLKQDEDTEYTRAAMMVRLQEEDEDDEKEGEEAEEEEDDITGGEKAHTSLFEIGSRIFSDQGYGDDDDARWKRRGGLDAGDEGKLEIRELDQNIGVDERRGTKKSVDAEEWKQARAGAQDGSALGDAQGSGSMRQRLPPTWSDLEQMVKMNSTKQSLLPSGSQLREDEE